MAKLYFLGEPNKTPSDGTLLGRTSRRFWWCWLLLLFFLTGGFYVFRAIFLCHRHSAPASQAREGFHRPWALPWLLSVALLFPRLFRHSFTASATFLSGNFLSTAFFTLHSFTNIFETVCDSDDPGSSSVPTLTELSLPADGWTWTTHIVVTRPLIYQLRQWVTKYRVKIELLNMFRLFKVICKDY